MDVATASHIEKIGEVFLVNDLLVEEELGERKGGLCPGPFGQKLCHPRGLLLQPQGKDLFVWSSDGGDGIQRRGLGEVQQRAGLRIQREGGLELGGEFVGQSSVKLAYPTECPCPREHAPGLLLGGDLAPDDLGFPDGGLVDDLGEAVADGEDVGANRSVLKLCVELG